MKIFVLIFLILIVNNALASNEEAKKAYEKRDYLSAYKIALPLASQGDPDSQNGLGLLYYSGLGVNLDYQQALKWFSLSAEQGNVKAMHNIGILYYYGYGVKTR